MTDTFKNGELFVYVNGDRWELGQVKRPNNDETGYFCWYSTGDTAANTPVECMHKLANAGWSHVEGDTTFRYVDEDYALECEYCTSSWDYGMRSEIEDWRYCPICRRKIVWVESEPDHDGFDETLVDARLGK